MIFILKQCLKNYNNTVLYASRFLPNLYDDYINDRGSFSIDLIEIKLVDKQ